jgi:predicted small secreted protein
MKKETLFFWALLLIVLALEGCATIRGIGEDIQSLGRALKRAVSDANQLDRAYIASFEPADRFDEANVRYHQSPQQRYQ